MLLVERLGSSDGDHTFEDVLLVSKGDGEVAVGRPCVDGASVKATILDERRGRKVVVFKKKKRKGGAGIKLPNIAELVQRVKDPLLLGAVASWVVALLVVGFLFVTQRNAVSALEDEANRVRQEERRYKTLIRQKLMASALRDSLVTELGAIREIDADRFVWPHILDEIKNILEKNMDDMTIHVSPIHGNFTPRNILFHEGRITGFIDWAMAEPDGASEVDLMDFIFCYLRYVQGKFPKELGFFSRLRELHTQFTDALSVALPPSPLHGIYFFLAIRNIIVRGRGCYLNVDELGSVIGAWKEYVSFGKDAGKC